MFTVFHRTWWRDNPNYPNGLEPSIGVSYVIKHRVETEDEARAICKEWNNSHEPGRLSRKAEYMGRNGDKGDYVGGSPGHQETE